MLQRARPCDMLFGGVRCRQKAGRPKHDLWGSLGRSSVMGGGSLFLRGACRLLPCIRQALLPIPNPTAAHPRTSARTPMRAADDTAASYSVAALPAAHISTLFVVGACPLSPSRNATQPTHTRRAPNMLSIGTRVLPFFCEQKTGVEKTLKSLRREIQSI